MDQLYEEIELAEKRIRQYLSPTPLIYSEFLSKAVNATLSPEKKPIRVYLKLESENLTGSFKVRGAYNKLDVNKTKGYTKFTTASTGNHALAVVNALKHFGLGGEVYLPTNAAQTKIDKLRAMIGDNKNIALKFHAEDCVETEMEARRQGKVKNLPFISPYNDLEIVAGQGTIGVELVEQFKKFEPDQVAPDAVIVPIGGGGLIAGIAAYFKQNPSTRATTNVIGVQPVNDAAMWASIAAGHIVDIEGQPTLSDATAGGIEREDNITFELTKRYVEYISLVEEDDIAKGIYLMLEKHNKVIEGSAGCSVAALFKEADKLAGKSVVLVICGANLGVKPLKSIIDKYSA
eukprot:TRINITY_DN11494_c0_g1_i1.p1 TRINITY_DN11494_c0_g1~~TRINITY_DN11494_c0_g1_i1.p1  ORF type:complete len:347 (+),score=92.48 TRINITY_DN11494_c0_g1_i1:25-1065(+)